MNELLSSEQTQELIQDGENTEAASERKLVPVAAKVVGGDALPILLVEPGHLSFEPVGVFLDSAVSEAATERAKEDDNAPAPEARDILIPYSNLQYVEYFFTEDEDDDTEE